jgi:conjugal transfer/entry exclusion protein
MSEPSENKQIQQFVVKLTSFGNELKNVADSNKAMVNTIEKETTELKNISLNLIKLVSLTIENLKQSIKAADKAGVPSGPLKEQMAKLEAILKELNNEAGTLKVNNETGRKIRDNLENIKSSLQQQEKILNDANGGPRQETFFGGKKRKTKRKHHKSSKHHHRRPLTLKKRKGHKK